jgi:hypothetical protein
LLLRQKRELPAASAGSSPDAGAWRCVADEYCDKVTAGVAIFAWQQVPDASLALSRDSIAAGNFAECADFSCTRSRHAVDDIQRRRPNFDGAGRRVG